MGTYYSIEQSDRFWHFVDVIRFYSDCTHLNVVLLV